MFGRTPYTAQATLRMAEASGATDGVSSVNGSGLIAGTKVASSLGWRVVEGLAAGDKVLTFDNGMQQIKEIRRTTLSAQPSYARKGLSPVVVPAGALGNRNPMMLLPEQGVMVESDAAQDAYGDPFAIVAASALVGFRGIDTFATIGTIDIVTLFFEEPQVIYVEGGALVYCPRGFNTLDEMVAPSSQTYGMLSADKAAYLVECMEIEEISAAYIPPQPEPVYAAA